MYQVIDFLEPVSLAQISDDATFVTGQFGRSVDMYDQEFPDTDHAQIILAGITECRGDGSMLLSDNAANQIRKQFYQLYNWHDQISVADVGNIKCGATLADTYAAIKTVVDCARDKNKIILLFGGSHDNTLGQYYSYRSNAKQINACCIDSAVDLSQENPIRSKNFLMEMLTHEPNCINHYAHLAFQSFLLHPHLIETLDKLRFDFKRLGHVLDDIEKTEPMLRDCDMVSFDIAAIKHSDAPANKKCINGLSGIEACTITRFAGMSDKLSSFGIYGYHSTKDVEQLTAVQVSQMIWYFIDGVSRRNFESKLEDRVNFNEYHTRFGEIETVFLQSKKTQRWWMQMPDESFIPCSHDDYREASQNQIPERWLRVQER